MKIDGIFHRRRFTASIFDIWRYAPVNEDDAPWASRRPGISILAVDALNLMHITSVPVLLMATSYRVLHMHDLLPQASCRTSL